MSEPWALVLTALDAPADVRAGLAAELAARTELAERSFLLSTCHRVELYGFGPRPAAVARAVAGVDAVRRLLRVAAGLESAALGEDEVLHQVRQAFADARARGLRDHRLHRLVEMAIATGRRARGRGKARSRSLEARAVDWLADQVPLRRVLVVGAGHIGGVLAAEARRRGLEVTVATRRPQPPAVDLGTAAASASAHDGVLVALGGRWKVSAAALPVVADLSSPSALAAETRAELGDRYLGIDDLFAVRDEDPEYAMRAEAEVERAAREYATWLEGRAEVTA